MEIDDVLCEVFAQINWTEVCQKDLVRVSKQWRRLLEDSSRNILFGYDLHKISLCSVAIVAQYSASLNWEAMLIHLTLTHEFMSAHIKHLEGYDVATFQTLSEEFIEQHSAHIDWESVSRSQQLSDDFLLRHVDKVCWPSLSIGDRLSDAFIEAHPELINWKMISKYRRMNKQFIEKYSDRLDHSYSRFW